MPAPETLEKFIKAVEEESHDKVIEKFYTEDASIQENQNTPRVGKTALVKNEQQMLAKAKTVTSKCIRPFFIQDTNAVIKWNFTFVWKDNSITQIEEIAHQIWEGEKITKEQFFYDPKQFIPKEKTE